MYSKLIVAYETLRHFNIRHETLPKSFPIQNRIQMIERKAPVKDATIDHKLIPKRTFTPRSTSLGRNPIVTITKINRGPKKEPPSTPPPLNETIEHQAPTSERKFSNRDASRKRIVQKHFLTMNRMNEKDRAIKEKERRKSTSSIGSIPSMTSNGSTLDPPSMELSLHSDTIFSDELARMSCFMESKESAQILGAQSPLEFVERTFSQWMKEPAIETVTDEEENLEALYEAEAISKLEARSSDSEDQDLLLETDIAIKIALSAKSSIIRLKEGDRIPRKTNLAPKPLKLNTLGLDKKAVSVENEGKSIEEKPIREPPANNTEQKPMTRDSLANSDAVFLPSPTSISSDSQSTELESDQSQKQRPTSMEIQHSPIAFDESELKFLTARRPARNKRKNNRNIQAKREGNTLTKATLKPILKPPRIERKLLEIAERNESLVYNGHNLHRKPSIKAILNAGRKVFGAEIEQEPQTPTSSKFERIESLAYRSEKVHARQSLFGAKDEQVPQIPVSQKHFGIQIKPVKDKFACISKDLKDFLDEIEVNDSKKVKRKPIHAIDTLTTKLKTSPAPAVSPLTRAIAESDVVKSAPKVENVAKIFEDELNFESIPKLELSFDFEKVSPPVSPNSSNDATLRGSSDIQVQTLLRPNLDLQSADEDTPNAGYKLPQPAFSTIDFLGTLFSKAGLANILGHGAESNTEPKLSKSKHESDWLGFIGNYEAAEGGNQEKSKRENHMSLYGETIAEETEDQVIKTSSNNRNGFLMTEAGQKTPKFYLSSERNRYSLSESAKSEIEVTKLV